MLKQLIDVNQSRLFTIYIVCFAFNNSVSNQFVHGKQYIQVRNLISGEREEYNEKFRQVDITFKAHHH